jgi:hypothetical protein
MGQQKLICLVLAAIFVVIPNTIQSLPVDDSHETAASSNDEERRATWLETRNIQDNFKQLVYLSMQELASEGLVNPDILLGKTQEKRGRHQGFCFKKTKSGRFLPYICWKDGDHEE